MMVRDVSAWLMVVVGGLFSGGIFIVAVERVSIWRRMPIDQYVIDFRRSLYRLDPLMPILGVLAAVSAVLFGVNADGHSAALAWMGAALIGVIIAASIVIAEPMNSRFRRLSEGQAPDGVDQLRINWRRFHWVRTVVALTSFACLAAAIA